MNTPTTLILACVAALASAELPAQQTLQSGIGQAVRPQVPVVDSAVVRETRGIQITRLALGLGGEFAGLVVGGPIGYMVYVFRGRDARGSDYPGLAEFTLGMIVGGVVGTATGAAFPRGRNICTGGRRMKLALLGSVIGGAAGLAIMDARVSGSTILAALAAPSAAAFALKGC